MAHCTAHVRSLRRCRVELTPFAAFVAVVLAASAEPASAQRLLSGVHSRPDGRPAAPVTVPATGAAPPTVTLPPNYDAAGPFFDGTALHDIHITMKAGDWETLKENYQLDTYYPADFEWRTVRVPRVGVRSRGAGGRSGIKPSLRLDFNRYVPEQEFLKLSAIVLANAVQDPAMLNRRLSMTVFAALELPAPRVVHARLFVNREYIGLYEAVEAIEKAFLKRAFGWDSTGRHRRDQGYLFEYKWDDGYDWSYFGYDLERYARLLEPKTHELDAPAVLYGPVDAMFRAFNEASDADFERDVGEYLYLAVFIRHLAVERYISDIDGFLGDWGPNNFFIYRFEGRNLSAVIPRGQGLDVLRPERRHLPGIRADGPGPPHPGASRPAPRLSREPDRLRVVRLAACLARVRRVVARGRDVARARPDPRGGAGGREQALHQRAGRRGAPGAAGVHPEPERARD